MLSKLFLTPSHHRQLNLPTKNSLLTTYRYQSKSLSFKKRSEIKSIACVILLTNYLSGISSNISIASESSLPSNESFVFEDEPLKSYLIDDASVLSRIARDEINNKLFNLEKRSGYKLVVAIKRKLEFEPDVFTFLEKLFDKWYKSNDGDKNGLLLIVTSVKDGALVGGKSFIEAIGDDLVDSIVGENIPIFTEKEMFNEAAISPVNRVIANLTGKNDPGAPLRVINERKRTYKTKEETDRVKPVTGAIVVTLLLIAFVVPMLQFYGYVSKD